RLIRSRRLVERNHPTAQDVRHAWLDEALDCGAPPFPGSMGCYLALSDRHFFGGAHEDSAKALRTGRPAAAFSDRVRTERGPGHSTHPRGSARAGLPA